MTIVTKAAVYAVVDLITSSGHGIAAKLPQQVFRAWRESIVISSACGCSTGRLNVNRLVIY
jgi:hypothetical protein